MKVRAAVGLATATAQELGKILAIVVSTAKDDRTVVVQELLFLGKPACG